MMRSLITPTLLALLAGVALSQTQPLNSLRFSVVGGDPYWTTQSGTTTGPITIRVTAAEGSCVLLFLHAGLDPTPEHEEDALILRDHYPWLDEVSLAGGGLAAALADEIEVNSRDDLAALPVGAIKVLPELVAETVRECVGLRSPALPLDADIVKAYGQCVLLGSNAAQIWDRSEDNWNHASLVRRDGTRTGDRWARIAPIAPTEFDRKELLRYAIEQQTRLAGYDIADNQQFIDSLTDKCGQIGMALTLQAVVLATDLNQPSRPVTIDPMNTRGLDCIDPTVPGNSNPSSPPPELILMDPVVVAIRLGDPNNDPQYAISLLPLPRLPGMSQAPPDGYAYSRGQVAYFYADKDDVQWLWLKRLNGLYEPTPVIETLSPTIVQATIPLDTTFGTAFFTGSEGLIPPPLHAFEGGIIYIDVPGSVTSVPWVSVFP